MLDIFLVSQSKLDNTFPSNLFKINRYKIYRYNLNLFGGGLILYIYMYKWAAAMQTKRFQFGNSFSLILSKK